MGVMKSYQEYQEAFNELLTKALQETGSPVWERKKRVSKEREARLVVSVELRNLFKEIAKRNNTNLQTAVWLAAHGFWKALKYNRADYNKIMFNSRADTLSDKDRKEIADFMRSIGLAGGKSSAKDDELTSAEHRLDHLNPEQKRQLVELMESKGVTF